MKLPIIKPTLPRDLKNRKNGQIPQHLLTRIEPSGVMHHRAADAWRALRAIGRLEGLTLGHVGDYRTYEKQVGLFMDRMRTYPDAKRTKQTTRRWKGQVWYLHVGAPVAVPGTSNHGWGLAIDAALRLVDGSVTTITAKPRGARRTGLEFLRAEGPSLGWFWELESEPWHIRYVSGDSPTPRLGKWLADNPS
jgi:LAS superfamily LD-carboxypeptidase LdcB